MHRPRRHYRRRSNEDEQDEREEQEAPRPKGSVLRGDPDLLSTGFLFFRLPHSLRTECLMWLSIRETLNLAAVSKAMYKLTDQDALWQPLYMKLSSAHPTSSAWQPPAAEESAPVTGCNRLESTYSPGVVPVDSKLAALSPPVANESPRPSRDFKVWCIAYALGRIRPRLNSLQQNFVSLTDRLRLLDDSVRSKQTQLERLVQASQRLRRALEAERRELQRVSISPPAATAAQAVGRGGTRPPTFSPLAVAGAARVQGLFRELRELQQRELKLRGELGLDQANRERGLARLRSVRIQMDRLTCLVAAQARREARDRAGQHTRWHKQA